MTPQVKICRCSRSGHAGPRHDSSLVLSKAHVEEGADEEEQEACVQGEHQGGHHVHSSARDLQEARQGEREVSGRRWRVAC